MQPIYIEQCAEAIDEVAGVLEHLCLKYPQVFDELQIRYPLADELGGFAGMLREHAQSLVKPVAPITSRLRGMFFGIPLGHLANEAGYRLPLQVLESAVGFYLGTANEEGPVSRESEEYWPTASEAAQALAGAEGETWTQRQTP